MAWDYIFASDSKTDFDPQLLEYINEKNNEQVESVLQNAKDRCTAVDISGASLLHHAAECGNETIAKLLIESGANVNLQDREGQTPLILATKGKHIDTIKLLLHSDADMFVCNKNGISSLFMAVHENPLNFDFTRPFLVEVKNDCYGAKFNAEEVAERLAKVDCPLYVAARLGNPDILKCLLSKGASIEVADPTFKRTALHVSVEAMNFGNVKFLLKQGADVNALDVSGKSPLALITRFEDRRQGWKNFEEFAYYRIPGVIYEENMLKILVNGKTDLTACTKDGFMQMYWALKFGNYGAVSTVLASGVDLRARDSYGRTAIHYLAENALQWSHAADALKARMFTYTRKVLKERRTNSSCLERIKGTFMDKVNEAKNLREVESEIVEWNACDKDGRTALHHAMAAGQVHFVSYLLGRGVNVNITTPSGKSPFIEAVDSSTKWTFVLRVRCVELLMEREDSDPAIEIERYFETRRTKSEENRHFALLQPLLAILVHRDVGGKEIPEKVRGIIESHEKMKKYVDFCRAEMIKKKVDGSASFFDDKRFGITYDCTYNRNMSPYI